MAYYIEACTIQPPSPSGCPSESRVYIELESYLEQAQIDSLDIIGKY